MGASRRLRLSEIRGVFEVVGECGELGHDPLSWGRHLLGGVQRLVGDAVVIVGEFPTTPTAATAFLSLVDTGWTGIGSRATYESWSRFVRAAPPNYHPAASRLLSLPATSRVRSRRQLLADRVWYRLPHYNEWLEPQGVDDALFGFHVIPGGGGLAVSPNRFASQRPFSARHLATMRLLMSELGRHLGKRLSTHRDPIARLSPRLRETLDALLEGDGEKQVALRLGIRTSTVREYVQAIYRHFGVNSRPELMAYFLRRPRREPDA
ncbi:MAG: LuxR C-terminal-related transcriptional regulator [Isosphaeraceae bacterium]|nr:LuxR C-terminal-related transcriptional regulator [Isosphaeraceae bacterium]